LRSARRVLSEATAATSRDILAGVSAFLFKLNITMKTTYTEQQIQTAIGAAFRQTVAPKLTTIFSVPSWFEEACLVKEDAQ